ncbi:MAG: hypothetical protein BRC25_02145, partial [Parcubacteria group bacterium SW_6_46_9]
MPTPKENQPPFNRFTAKAREAIRDAHRMAVERQEDHVNPQHLLSALIQQDDSIVISLLQKLDVDISQLSNELASTLSDPKESLQDGSPSYQIYLTPELAKTLEASTRIAQNMDDEYVSTEHLLLSVLSNDSDAKKILTKFGIKKSKVKNVLDDLRDNKGKPAQRTP